ncbi:thiomuracin/GE37468 family thiazolyl RiPP peptide [[Actinomadura] parvosata]|uniref:thiomuracin/GE37468 family thiazolyl RiPP peptide n=1 Tax=[Actinomadura] parvosata TaxID=1955412 RepID=UPI00406D3E45
MPTSRPLDFDVHDLPMDIFDLTVSGLEVETLTLRPGTEIVASLSTKCYPCSGTTGCSSCTDKPHSLPGIDEDEDEE